MKYNNDLNNIFEDKANEVLKTILTPEEYTTFFTGKTVIKIALGKE